MKRTLCWMLLALLAFAGVSRASAAIRVVATLPDLGAITEYIGGSHVQVETLARGTEDPHFIDPRPSFVRLLNRADALVEGGAGLESGWLPPLVQNARNAKILPGRPGRIVASAGLALLDVPERLDRSQGDVHPYGNPHYTLDPELARRVASTIAEGLSAIDSGHAMEYRERAQKFGGEIESKLEAWREQLAPCKGAKVISYHKSFDYLLRQFGFEQFDTIEPKPGIEPSPSHMTHLIQRAKAAEVRLVIAESFRPRRTGERVASESGAAYVELPVTVGGDKEAKDYFAWMDLVVDRLAKACGKSS